MSNLIINKLVTPCGTLGDSNTPNIVDMAGNLKTSPQFLANLIVDAAGNVGSISLSLDCTFIATIIGSALEPGPWEVQKGTVEDVGSNMSVNPDNYATAITAFASANTTGFMAGVVSGSLTWTVQGGTQSIGGVAYQGGGLIVTTAANTLTGVTTVQSGANFQIGEDFNNVVAKVGPLTNQINAKTTIFGAWTTNFFVTQAIINQGVINIIGPKICGQGNMLANTVNNNGGVINIKDAVWRNQSTWTGGGGSTVNVLDGGTFRLTTVGIPNTQINLNGCGWCDASGNQVGALEFTSTNFALGATVAVKSPSCIKTVSGSGVNGVLSGSQPLRVFPPTIGTLPTQNITFGSASNTYHGELTIDNTTLILASQSLQYADIILERAARISGTGTIGSLSSDDQSTYWVQASGNSFIKSNGETTFAGRFIGDGSTARNHWLEGGEENILRLTHNTTVGGHTATLYARNGSKVYLEDGTKFTGETGQIRISLGSTLSANTTTSSATYIYLDSGAILDVQAIDSTTASKITATKTIASSGGYKVNVPAGLVAGSYPILQANTGGTIVPQLPAINQNLSGLNASFSWNTANPRILTMTLS
jgi:hypothetical protein